jgi:hypothetical protein
MNDEKQRAAFEEWMKHKWPGCSLCRQNRSDEECPEPYVDFEATVAWEAWQVALEHAKKTMCNRN